MHHNHNGSRIWLCMITVLIVTASPFIAEADPVNGDIFDLEQPAGTTVSVRIWGDEFYRVVESLDGYTLVRDEVSGEICYARLSRDGDRLESTHVSVSSARGEDQGLIKHLRIKASAVNRIVSAARARHNAYDQQVLAQLRLQKDRLSAPSSGNVVGICLIIDFSDEVSTIPASEIDSYCNQAGYSGYGNNGSVRDYFYDVSDGNLTYTNYVTPSYYRAQQPKSYYDDCSVPSGVRSRELIIEALDNLESSGFDFSQYDSNADGLIDGINCFYAGTRGCGWAMGLWPHSGGLTWSADGVSAYRFQITDMRSTLYLSTFCHENGHMICYWPDLYDYGYESAGVGRFCLMCNSASGTNPIHPCAYLKYYSEWATVFMLSGTQLGLSVPSGTNTYYKYEHPTLENEYFLIENRQQLGRDTAIPDAGLAIWHIDTEGSNNNEQMTTELHYKVTLVQADGNWDLEHDVNSGDATDLWAAPEYTECNDDTNPNTNWWNWDLSGLNIFDISTTSPNMTFSVDYHAPITYYLNASGTGDFPTIQDALQASESGDTIILSDGVYTGLGNIDLDFMGRNVVLKSQSENPDLCVIDCAGSPGSPHRGLYFHSGEATSSRVIGVKIVNGYVEGAYPNNQGAGILCDNGASPRIENCIFADGHASDDGGGVACQYGASPMIVDCVFGGNDADYEGAAVSLSNNSQVDIHNCTFIDNDAAVAALYVGSGCSAVVDGSIFDGNNAFDGGAITCFQGTVALADCQLFDNTCDDWGGAVRLYEATGTFTQCSFVRNSAGQGAAALLCTEGSSATLIQCIIAYSQNSSTIYCAAGGSASLSCCNLYANYGGDWVGCIAGQAGVNGNISEDPLFCDIDNDNFLLDEISPCATEQNPECGRIGALPVGCSNYGTIIIDIEPDSIMAPWILTSTSADSFSGQGDSTFVQMPTVFHCINWGDVEDYVAPILNPVCMSLEGGGTAAFTGVYLRDIGNLTIDCAPDSLAAPWHLEGPYGYDLFSNSDTTLSDLRSGEYTLTWLNIPNWFPPLPNPDIQFLPPEDNLAFTGQYVPAAGFTDVTAGPLGDVGPGRGVCAGDYDNDGDQDLYIVNSGQANVLLRNDGSGTFIDVTAAPLDDAGPGSSAAWADCDNDGDLDLYLTNHSAANRLFRNDGSGIFVDMTASPIDDAGPGLTVNWTDYDGDGMIDLYLVNEGVPNCLYNCFGTFGESTYFVLVFDLHASDAGDGSCAAWADYDQDGDPDLYHSRLFQSNLLLQNNPPSGFMDMSVFPVNITSSGNGVAWGDYDNDLDMDLYVANEIHADCLFRNEDAGSSFTEITGQNLGNTGFCTTVAWVDYDNDGDLDIFLTRNSQSDLILENVGGNNFNQLTLSGSGGTATSMGAAWLDYDGDGDLDAYIVKDGQPNTLLRNESEAIGNSWLHVDLVGTVSNKSAIGAKVYIYSDSIQLIQEVSGGDGYCSQNSMTVEFGLGSAVVVDSMVIHWPSGIVQDTTNVEVDQRITIVERDPVTGIKEEEKVPSVYSLHESYPNPFNPMTTIRYDLPQASRVTLLVYDLSGRLVRSLLSGETMSAGHYEAIWQGRDDSGRSVASGTYFYRLTAGKYTETRRMVLVK